MRSWRRCFADRVAGEAAAQVTLGYDLLFSRRFAIGANARVFRGWRAAGSFAKGVAGVPVKTVTLSLSLSSLLNCIFNSKYTKKDKHGANGRLVGGFEFFDFNSSTEFSTFPVLSSSTFSSISDVVLVFFFFLSFDRRKRIFSDMIHILLTSTAFLLSS